MLGTWWIVTYLRPGKANCQMIIRSSTGSFGNDVNFLVALLAVAMSIFINAGAAVSSDIS